CDHGISGLFSGGSGSGLEHGAVSLADHDESDWIVTYGEFGDGRDEFPSGERFQNRDEFPGAAVAARWRKFVWFGAAGRSPFWRKRIFAGSGSGDSCGMVAASGGWNFGFAVDRSGDWKRDFRIGSIGGVGRRNADADERLD